MSLVVVTSFTTRSTPLCYAIFSCISFYVTIPVIPHVILWHFFRYPYLNILYWTFSIYWIMSFKSILVVFSSTSRVFTSFDCLCILTNQQLSLICIVTSAENIMVILFFNRSFPLNRTAVTKSWTNIDTSASILPPGSVPLQMSSIDKQPSGK